MRRAALFVLAIAGSAGARAQAPAPGDVVINEVMYDPPASHGSSANEWIELVNRSAGAIDLSQLHLADATSAPVPVATQPTILAPGAFAVLVRTAGEFTSAFPGVAFVAVAGFPALNNSGDRPRILAGAVEIDAVPYAGAWGGADRSLERRDPAGASAFPGNWGSTTSPAGGTPAAQNTLFAPDADGPTIVDVELAVTADTLVAHFDQPLDAATVTASAFVLAGAGAPAVVGAASGGLAAAHLALAVRLPAGAYTLAAPGVRGANGSAGTAPPYPFVADPDLTPPALAGAGATDSVTVDVTFSEAVDASAAEPSRYGIDAGVGTPTAVEHPLAGDRRRARLALAVPLARRSVYTLTVTGVRDVAGNTAGVLSATLLLGPADAPAPGDLVVNEIMFDPSPGGAEYVELLNASMRTFDLREIGVTDGPAAGASPASAGAAVVMPGAFVVLTNDAERFAAVFPGVTVVRAQGFPSLNNGGDAVVVAYAGAAVDSLTFDPAWHRVELEDATGVALERRAPADASTSGLNWSSSLDPSGGTPGRVNSISTVAGVPPDDAGLAVSRSPFDPDAGEATSIAYTLRGEAGLVRARVFDGAGREVREIEAGRLTGRTGSIPWDGRGGDGRPVRIGIYVVLLESVDVEAGTSESHRAAVVVARR